MRRLVAIGIALAVATPARAEPGEVAIGILVGMPGQGSGAPIGGAHVPGGIVGRFELAPRARLSLAISGGLGTPIAGVGASAWGGLELGLAPAPHLQIYATPGVRTGFVGNGYYARRSGVFVGYEYLYAGPWTIAPRLAAGIAAPIGPVRLFAEGLVEAPLLPSPEVIVGAGVGVRVRL